MNKQAAATLALGIAGGLITCSFVAAACFLKNGVPALLAAFFFGFCTLSILEKVAKGSDTKN